METHGFFTPETPEQARERYGSLEVTAKGVVREVARAMEFDGDEYGERVTDEVVETARDALFASLLEVRTGSREEFDEWRDGTDLEVVEVGSENVDRVAWHAPPFSGTVVAATYQNQPEAAVETLRRQAFGRLYRDLLGEDQ
jgi:hypothetical protein